jgi:hypothetical protein
VSGPVAEGTQHAGRHRVVKQEVPFLPHFVKPPDKAAPKAILKVACGDRFWQ